MITIDQIRTALQHRTHLPATFEPAPTQAAVAMILADGEDDLEVCFIRRAERAGDPWSGQVAFPGGRAGSDDRNAHDVAERETWEEIGLSLAADHRIGPLPIREVVRPDIQNSLTLSPFVYYIGTGSATLDHASHAHEVADVFWVPLRHLFAASAATELDYPIGGVSTTFPGIQFRDQVIWGLTLSVLNSFADIVRPHLTAATEAAP
ncbi:MAG: CoA pyrophosphatase [Gammaproteobacteria bacterium]|nr:CoA pyrophosphatase [Gammaproteobacteria bacterium]